MAGGKDDGEMAALREALRQQKLAVEMLKVELEEERQAASSGADEALAMILRLQAEKAAERMEAEQYRRVAEERILHDEDSLAFLKAVVFNQEMDISSLKLRLLAVCGDAPAAAGDGAVDLPWLRKLAKNGVSARRNSSLPAARLEELCPDFDAGGGGGEDVGNSLKNVGEIRTARTVSDIGEVLRREMEWVRSNVSHLAPPPRLHRSASHRLRRAPSYSSAQCGPYLGIVHDKYEAPESVASHAPLRSSRRASPEIISEEDDSDGKPRNARKNRDHATIAELGADIEQIKGSVQSLVIELSRMRESSMSRGDAEARLLTEICTKLDAMNKQQHVQGDKRETSREEGSSSKGGGCPQSELLMNHFIEVCAIISSALIVRPFHKVAASMSFFRFFLILALAVVFSIFLVNS